MTPFPAELADGVGSRTPSWLRAWFGFLFAPIDPTGLGFLRLCCGALVFYTHLCYSYDLFSYVGPNAWLDAPAQNYLRKETPISVPETAWGAQPTISATDHGQYFWSIYYHVRDPFRVVIIHLSILAVMLLFTAGLWTRVTSVLAWLGAMQYVQRLPTSMFGMDTMMIILLTYLMIGDGGAALSLDRWLELRRQRREQGRTAPLRSSWSANFAMRLLQIHFCVVYFVSGTSKLLGSAWWSGTAFWLCLANYNFAPMRVGAYNAMLIFLCQHFVLWQIVLTASAVFTLFTEISFPYLVWNRRLRPFMVSCSVLMHLGIGLIMGLVVFSLFMMVMVLSFIPPEVIRSYLDQFGDSITALAAGGAGGITVVFRKGAPGRTGAFTHSAVSPDPPAPVRRLKE